MNSDYAMANAAAPQTRSVEDSISHAHDASRRASSLANLILDDLNGHSPETGQAAEATSFGGGLVRSADVLASRLESLCQDLERVRERLASTGPKQLAPGNRVMDARLGAF